MEKLNVVLPVKDKNDLRITHETKYKPISAKIAEWTPDGKLKGITGKITITLSQNIEQHQNGIMGIEIKGKKETVKAYVHIDVIQSLAMAAYGTKKQKSQFEV